MGGVGEVKSGGMQGTAKSAEEVLILCLERGRAEDWTAFVAATQPLLALVVMRAVRGFGDKSIETVDDLVQEIYLKLCAENCKVLRAIEFRHPQSLSGFLKATALNSVQDHFKKQRARKRWGHLKRDEFSDGDTEIDERTGVEAVDRKILLREVDQHLKEGLTKPERDRNRRIFWLYYRHGLTAKAIAAIPSVQLSAKGVETVVSRMTRLVRRRMAGGR